MEKLQKLLSHSPQGSFATPSIDGADFEVQDTIIESIYYDAHDPKYRKADQALERQRDRQMQLQLRDQDMEMDMESALHLNQGSKTKTSSESVSDLMGVTVEPSSPVASFHDVM